MTLRPTVPSDLFAAAAEARDRALADLEGLDFAGDAAAASLLGLHLQAVLLAFIVARHAGVDAVPVQSAQNTINIASHALAAAIYQVANMLKPDGMATSDHVSIVHAVVAKHLARLMRHGPSHVTPLGERDGRPTKPDFDFRKHLTGGGRKPH